MADIDLNSLMGMIGSDGVKTLSKLTNTSGPKVQAVLSDALPVLVGKMSDNASTKTGAESLNKALNEHRTGELIDAASFLASADTADGKKILGHILGADESAATKAISKKSGVSGSKVGTILAMVAPLLLTQIGNKKDDDNAGSSALGGLLGGLLGGNSNEQEEEKEEESSSGSLLGGLGSLAMNLFGDSSALSSGKEETTTSGKKKTGKKTGTTSGKKTGTATSSTGKKTAKKTGTASSAKKAGTTSTGKKTAKKTTKK